MDIEDLGKVDIDNNQRIQERDVIIHRNNINEEICETTINEGIPNSQKIFIKTWGCSHNNSDGEYMAGK